MLAAIPPRCPSGWAGLRLRRCIAPQPSCGPSARQTARANAKQVPRDGGRRQAPAAGHKLLPLSGRRGIGAGIVAVCGLVAALLALPAAASSVSHRTAFVNGIGCHIVQVNLNSPKVKVTPIVALGFPGSVEPMQWICKRTQPTAAVTGTFFSKATKLPVGDIVIDGRLAYFGGMGSVIAITPDNRVVFERVPYGRHQDWGAFETVLGSGPTLVTGGEVALAPRHEGFSDSHVLGRASRNAVGLTPANKLLLVATRELVGLWELARVMKGLGCIEAINLDGGTSTSMYYRGKMVVKPGRWLVNLLGVYENVPAQSRTCKCELPTEREAIYRWRAARASEAYLRAMEPLAKGELEEAVRLLDEATRLDSLNASYQVRLAGVLAQQQKVEAASGALSRAGEILLAKRLYKQAASRLQEALDYNPSNRLAQVTLPRVYRKLGMGSRAEIAEYHLRMNELEDNLIAAHPALMREMSTEAYELAGVQVTKTGKRGPRLSGHIGERAYVDPVLGLRLELPPGWEFVARDDASALLMRHRFRAYLGHLRGVSVPESIELDKLVELYYGGSFQRELYKFPIHGAGLRGGKWATEMVSMGGPIYCDTLFTRSAGYLWILSLTTGEELREQARQDFDSIIKGLTFFGG